MLFSKCYYDSSCLRTLCFMCCFESSDLYSVLYCVLFSTCYYDTYGFILYSTCYYNSSDLFAVLYVYVLYDSSGLYTVLYNTVAVRVTIIVLACMLYSTCRSYYNCSGLYAVLYNSCICYYYSILYFVVSDPPNTSCTYILLLYSVFRGLRSA